METRQLTHWKTLGIIACALTFTACLQAAQPTVKIITTDATALEGTSSGAFTLIRTGDTNAALAVNVDISGTASNGVDYTTVANPVIIPAGYLAVDVLIQPLINNVTRGNKTVVLSLLDDAAYRVTGRGHGTVKIIDDIFDVPPPTVALTSPVDGSVSTSPAVLTLAADVESEVLVQRVNFYQNDKLIGTVSNSPYTMLWTNSSNGKVTFFARAVDEFDKAGVSDPAHVTISATPVVSVSSLAGNDVFQYQLIPLQAQIADANEQISSVSFYVNKKLVGTVTSAPFTFQWEDDVVGTFTIQAIATDANTGKTGSSSKITVHVSPFIGGGN